MNASSGPFRLNEHLGAPRLSEKSQYGWVMKVWTLVETR